MHSDARSDILPLDTFLPLRAVAITLRFLAPAQPPLFHQPPLTAFLRHLLDSPDNYDLLLAADAPESGHTRYRSGDRYSFSLFAFPGSENLLQTALTKLHALPDTAKPVDRRAPFRDNLAFCEARDLFWGHSLRSADALYVYARDDLAQETEAWSQMAMARLRWLSPVRLLREKGRREGEKGEARFCRTQRHVTYPLLADRLQDTFADLLRRRGFKPPERRPAQPLGPTAADLFWVDCRYGGERDGEQPMGGLMGTVDLAGFDRLSPADQALWVLGQYYGIGQRRAFGWGRFVLETPEGEVTCRRARPATSILERVAEADNLGAAYEAIEANRGPRFPPDQPEPEWDGADADDGADDDAETAERLERLAERLAAERYRPPPLRGIVQRKTDGSLRALAVPPFLDRVAQRAVAQILTPGLEPLMYHGSFGYRPKRSRFDAKQMIQTAYQEGYRWVYESDIDDFFDSVDWTRLHTRLAALYGDDPLVDLIMAWMAAPVEYQAQRIQRAAGLPQGAPLSPLLANLMLDDFDSDLEAMGFRLARFADDFVILCKSREEAEAAAGAAVQSLTEIGLRINRDKTAIRSFEQGFRYLGYLFVNSLALDVGGEKKAEPEATSPSPPAGWLAHLYHRTPQAIAENGQIALANPPPEPPTPPLGVPVTGDAQDRSDAPVQRGEQDGAGTLVLVAGPPTQLTTREGRLHLWRDDEPLASMPWADVRAVVLIGPHSITTPALITAMRRGAPVHFASAGGHYQGTAWSGQPGLDGPQLWLLQQARFADPDKAIAAARGLVDARLRHMHEVARQRALAGGDPEVGAAIDSLKRSLTALPDARSLDVLNGIEGQATRAYYSVLKALVPAPFGFEGRNRRPPQDPFNALLSLGYTILYAHVDTVLRADGLLPWLGFYHQHHGRHLALASDLMEPFRHLVERTALTAVTRHRLKPQDFHLDAVEGCRLEPRARKRYLALLSERFDTPITALQGSEPKTLGHHLHDQNRSLIAWIKGQAPEFTAWRMR